VPVPKPPSTSNRSAALCGSSKTNFDSRHNTTQPVRDVARLINEEHGMAKDQNCAPTATSVKPFGDRGEATT
jgi:hypothetical protein